MADSENASVWLETTKENNVEIFNKMGYNFIDSKNELSVDYYIMTKKNVPNKMDK